MSWIAGANSNAAYNEDDQKFMRFLIPPASGCWSWAAAAEIFARRAAPSLRASASISEAATIAKANARHPDLVCCRLTQIVSRVSVANACQESMAT